MTSAMNHQSINKIGKSAATNQIHLAATVHSLLTAVDINLNAEIHPLKMIMTQT